MIKKIGFIGAPSDAGASCRGSMSGPNALRAAHIRQALDILGLETQDAGNLIGPETPYPAATTLLKHLQEVKEWTKKVYAASSDFLQKNTMPILLGGDHSLAIGSIWAALEHAEKCHTPLHVIWFDAHADFNTHTSSQTGNIHGMPLSVLTGDMQDVFDLPLYLPQENIHLVGIRDVDILEKERLRKSDINVYDMQTIDRLGIEKVISEIVEKIRQDNGVLHISFDIDVMDPDIMPGVGTPAIGGLTIREVRQAFQYLQKAPLISLDILELNPLLDTKNKTAENVVYLVGFLFGKTLW